MTDANNNIELNTKPLSPEVVLPVGEVAAPKIPEEEAEAQKVENVPAEKQVEEKVEPNTQAVVETQPGVGYQLPADSALVESDETTARLLLLRDKMRRGEIPSNQE